MRQYVVYFVEHVRLSQTNVMVVFLTMFVKAVRVVLTTDFWSERQAIMYYAVMNARIFLVKNWKNLAVNRSLMAFAIMLMSFQILCV